MIDWAAFTFKLNDPQEVINIIGLKASLFTELERGIHGYRKSLRYGSIGIFFDGQEIMGCHVVMSGQGYRPIAELMILTGMIVSELSALTKDSIQSEYLKLTSSYVLKEEKTNMKTAFRKRDIYITEAIRKRLDILTARAKTSYLVTSSRGTRLNSTDFAKVWKKAVERAGINPMTSYIARHSFAAWSLTIGINPLRLVKLMGHASKQMVYERCTETTWKVLKRMQKRFTTTSARILSLPGKRKARYRLNTVSGTVRGSILLTNQSH